MIFLLLCCCHYRVNKRLCKHARHIRILLFIAVIFTNKRRISHNKTGIRAHSVPVGLQGVSINDIGRLFQRYAGKISAEMFADLLVHLVVGEP